MLVALAGMFPAQATTSPPYSEGSKLGCALALAIKGYNDRDYLPRVGVTPDDAERTFIRMQERAPSASIALLWLKHWGRARALRVAIAKEPLATRLRSLGLTTAARQLVFLNSLSEFDLADFILNQKASAKFQEIAQLMNAFLDPDTFFPTADKSGLEDDKYVVYDDVFNKVSLRLGLAPKTICSRFEAWFRGRKKSQPLGEALFNFLNSMGAEI